MAERPILFNAEMVRAVLDGRKTQTRRVLRHQPRWTERDQSRGEPLDGWYWTCSHAQLPFDPTTWEPWGICHHADCPYGAPGDTLYVKEAWRSPVGWDDLPPRDLRSYEPRIYLADGDGDREFWGRYRHARFMPRALSRLDLRVTEVRVERVQDISEEDIIAEGVSTTLREHDAVCDLRDRFAALWDAINGKRPGPKHIRRRPPRGKPTDRYEAAHPEPPIYPYSWVANPWVWAVSFEVAGG